MGRLLDELKALVHNQTQKLGTPVANIHGAAQSPVVALSGAEQSTWLALHIPGRRLASLEAFYAAFSATDTRNTRVLDTTTGAVVARYDGIDSTTVLLRGAAEVTHPRSFSLAVQTGDQQADFVVALDGRVVRTGVGGGEVALYLEPGAHVIEVLANSTVVGVQVPKDLRIRGDFERIPTPVWRSITTGYLDNVQGQAVVNLSWFVDQRAGGWRILRRQLESVSGIEDLGSVNTNLEFVVKLAGDQTAALILGEELYAMHSFMGTILELFVEGASTIVRLRLPGDLLATSPFWVGLTATKGRFTEVQRVGRTQAVGDVSWSDVGVTAGVSYDYALQAWGFVDSNTWSPRSEIRPIRAGDTTAPAAIVFAPTYPKALNKQAIVKFTTPADTDYAGVKVYYRQKHTGTATSGTANSITNTGASFPTLDATWRVRITSGTGEGQERIWQSNTATSITVSSNWLVTPNATSVYLVYKDTSIHTDYGLPNTTDQFAFEPISTDPAQPAQEYQFRTFDHALNEQEDYDAVTWTFTPSTDGAFSAPPVIRILQVPTTHATLVDQADFSTPFNNTKRYAILELAAADAAGRTTGVTIHYLRRFDNGSTSIPASTAPATEGGTPANIDNPLGTRSRYIAIERNHDQNWVKVHAIDAAGNRSDTITYSVDFDDQPEIASFEARLDTASVFGADWNTTPGNEFGSGVVGVQGLVRVSGAVDDDARSLRYWLEDPTGTDPTATTHRTINLTTDAASYILRSFAFAFTLADGERKNLIMEPWSGSVTTGPTSLSATATGYARAAGSFTTDGFVPGMEIYATGFTNALNNGASVITSMTATSLTVQKTGGTAVESAAAGRAIAAGVPGPRVQRDFTRTPRSQAHFESKDELGNASGKKVKALFDIFPAPTAVSGFPTPHAAHATASAHNTIQVASGTPFTTDQYNPLGRIKYFVLASGATSRGGTWSSSGVTLSGAASLINDGNTAANAYHTNSAVPGAFVQVDMGAGPPVRATRFNQVKIWTSAANYKGEYKVRASTDNVNWIDFAGGFVPGSSGANTFVFQPPLGFGTQYRYWRLELTNTPGSGAFINEVEFSFNRPQCAKIIDTTTTTLTVEPDWTANGAIPHAGTFQIIDSAIFYAFDGVSFKPTAGVEFFERQDKASTQVDYYASKNKIHDEEVKRVHVDADTIPSFTGVLVTAPAANTVRVTAQGPDDDVKYWRVYRRKGAIPTAAGGVTWPAALKASDLDRGFLHHGPVEVSQLSYDSFAGDGTHYIAVVPTNALNEDGTPITTQHTIAAGAALSNLRVVIADGNGMTNNRVLWDHNSAAEAPTEACTVKVYASKKNTLTGAIIIPEVEITGVGVNPATRLADLDSESGTSEFTNASDTDTAALQGSWIHTGDTASANIDSRTGGELLINYTWTYRVELYAANGTTLKNSYTVSHTSGYVPSGSGGATTVASCTATVVSQGSGSGDSCASAPQNRIDWTVNNADGNYLIAVEFSVDPNPSSGATWSMLISGINSTIATTTYHDMQGFYGGGSTTRRWTYRVWAYRASDGPGVVSGSKWYSNNSTTAPVTPTLTYSSIECGGGGQF